MIPLALAERLGLPPEVLDQLRARDARRKAQRVHRSAAKAREAARVAAVYASMPRLRPDAPIPSRRVVESPRPPSRGRGVPLPPTSCADPLSPGKSGPMSPADARVPSPRKADAPRFPSRGRAVPAGRGRPLTPGGSGPPHPQDGPRPSRSNFGGGPPHPPALASPSPCKGAPPLPATAGMNPPLPLGGESGGGTPMNRSAFRILFTRPEHVRGDLRDLRAAVKAGRVTPENTPHLADALERALALIVGSPATFGGLMRRLRALARLAVAMEEAGERCA